MALNAPFSIALILALLGPQEPDFYRCTGTATYAVKQPGRQTHDKPPLPEQIFAIDASRGEIGRALPKRREYENLCSIVPANCKVSITPARAQLNGTKGSDRDGTTMTFDLDRATGAARFQMIVVTGERRAEVRWNMSCKVMSAPKG
jgi:hypothetical protein